MSYYYPPHLGPQPSYIYPQAAHYAQPAFAPYGGFGGAPFGAVRAAAPITSTSARTTTTTTTNSTAAANTGGKKKKNANNKYDSICDLVHGTPNLRVSRLYEEDFPKATVWAKLERSNPGGSIKDRIALGMVEDAERKGLITPGETTIFEVTSGNTGIGLAMVAAAKGYECILIMPSSMSIERRKLMTAYGAELVVTDAAGGIKAAFAARDEIKARLGDAGWEAQQFENPANIQAHVEHTVEELKADFPGGVDYVVGGLGTGAHMTACGETLRKSWPKTKFVAFQPAAAPIYTGGKFGPHRIQGVAPGFVAENTHLDAFDEIIDVANDDALAMANRSAKELGLLVGISSGASLAAVKQILEREPTATVLAFTYDTGERYLSIDDLWTA